MLSHARSGNRRTIRLPHWDYRNASAYFLTICAADRAIAFGNVVGDEVSLTSEGEVVLEEWLRSAKMRPTIDFDAFIVMPNHFHGIVVLREPVRQVNVVLPRGRNGCVAASLGSLVAGFKAATTSRINELCLTHGASVWQRNFYERILRNERELDLARQ